jgi:hypothetical protein
MKLLDDLFFCVLLVTIAIYLSSLRLCELCDIKKPLKALNGYLTIYPWISVQRNIFHQKTV